MFIVTNESALRVSRKGCLAGAGKTKEERHVTIFSRIGRTVHGKDMLVMR